MPLVECMACGVPSITSDKHSPPEVVGDTGLLVDPYNVSDIANKMVEINEGNTLQILSQRALQRSKNYSWETYATKIFELYEKNAKFTGDWDFEKQYELAGYHSLLFVCVFIAGKENKILSEYLLDLDFQKIVQWASEYGLKDPKVRDFLIPFKRFIENYNKNDDHNKLLSDNYIHQAMVHGLKQSNEALQVIVNGLKESNESFQVIVNGLKESKKQDTDMIRGLERSVDEWKKTVDDIYNSTTWKLVSKFTREQTKRKKN
tara:strand:- start:355 stop:1137 length:783 start_codon:yes stop_codon:yes gene_type:complete